MHVREVLEFVDKAVYIKTGKHLNDLQRGIIEGTLKRHKYTDIAETYGCSAGHVKDIGYELLQLLSDVFNEPVDKGNLKSVLERQGNLNISLGDRSYINSNIIGCINMGSENPKNTSDEDENPIIKQQFGNLQNQAKIEIINKLRQFGLSDEQINEVLELKRKAVESSDFAE